METQTAKKIISQCPTWDIMIRKLLENPEVAAMQKQILSLRGSTTIYPDSKDVLNAYRLTPFNDVLVVIIGQDPYHDGSAHGLSFSSLSKRRPPSLDEIFKEVCNSYYPGSTVEECFKSNNLSSWAKQGVLLLNRALTVESGKPKSHMKIGWDKFLIQTIETLNTKSKPIVYMLWGSEAQKLKSIINAENLILEAEHPAAHFHQNRPSKFRGCNHFALANHFIQKHYKPFKAPIGWAIL